MMVQQYLLLSSVLFMSPPFTELDFVLFICHDSCSHQGALSNHLHIFCVSCFLAVVLLEDSHLSLNK